MTNQEAIERIQSIKSKVSLYDDVLALRMAEEALKNQKTGHWILTDIEGYRVWHCNCSECGKDPQTYIGGSENWWLIKNKLPKYCPNCCAKMEGDK